ncbi:MAG TPA: hypothetical protein ENN97_08735 [Phycisphaerales bacterium]|nr:hypothetical protein [Phycisphaerales bacterium]
MRMIALSAAIALTTAIAGEPNVPSRDSNVLTLDPNTAELNDDPNAAPDEIIAEHTLCIPLPEPVLTVITPATDVPSFRYRLTFRLNELVDGDSWDYYQKFFAVDPNHPERVPDAALLREQLALRPEEMNIEKLTAHFEMLDEKTTLLEQAVRCRNVVWPKITPPQRRPSYLRGWRYGYDEQPTVPSHLRLKIAEIPELLEKLDTAAMLLAAQARFWIARGDYDQASRWLRTALAQGRQMTRNAEAPLAMAGAAHLGRALNEIECWVQQPSAPSLFRPLSDLPRPLVVFSNVFGTQRVEEFDSADILEVEPDFLSNAPHIVQSIERLRAALQCIEAMRLHAALNEGVFPHSLTEITDVRVPLDPMTRQAFVYERRNGVFILLLDDDVRAGQVEFRYRILRNPDDVMERKGILGMPGMPMY